MVILIDTKIQNSNNNNIYFIHDAILLALHNHSLSHPTFHRRTMQVSQNDKHNNNTKKASHAQQQHQVEACH